MPDPVVKTDTSSATWLGRMSAIVAKGIAGMSPAERAEFLADASTRVSSEMGKASEMLNHHDEMTGPFRQIEDLWDGPPDDHLEVGGGHGPGSTAPAGKVNVGPNQAASGNGAEKMEREYSRPTPQTGVQAATEKLGRDIMGIKGAMKSMLTAMEAQGLQIDLVKSSIATIAPPPDEAAISRMVKSAITEALAPITKSLKALKKAESEDDKDSESDRESGEGDEAEDEEDDDDAEEEESGSGTDIEIVNENEADDEDEGEEGEEKAKAITAARFRLMAKCRVKWANKRFAKAVELAEDGKPKSAALSMAKGRGNLRKAQSYLDAAKALRNRVGPSGKAIAKSILKAKAKSTKVSDNQDHWPNKGDTGVGKGDAGNGAANDVTGIPAAVSEAITQLGKAASGMSLLVTNMQGVFGALGQSKNPGEASLPPAVRLAMAKGGASKSSALDELAGNGTISYDDADAARDILRLAGTSVPEEFINQKIALLPAAARNILTAAA